MKDHISTSPAKLANTGMQSTAHKTVTSTVRWKRARLTGAAPVGAARVARTDDRFGGWIAPLEGV